MLTPILRKADARCLPLPDKSVHVIVTSPPYYGLRQYGDREWQGGDPSCDHKPGSESRAGGSTLQGNRETSGHRYENVFGETCPRCGATSPVPLGAEAEPDCLGWATRQPCGHCYICRMVEVFREARRVLRDDGTLWIVEGDSYANSRSYQVNGTKQTEGSQPVFGSRLPNGLKEKDMMAIPWRLGLALQADGWWLRRVIIWNKPNGMPQSVNDRPSNAHEYILLLSKRRRYHYDQAATKTPLKPSSVRRVAQKNLHTQLGGWKSEAYEAHHPGQKQRDRRPADVLRATANLDGANLRDVWTIPTQRYDGPHFATFPVEIPRRAILAATSEAGCCPQCGTPWRRIVKRRDHSNRREPARQPGNVPSKTDSSGQIIVTQPTAAFRPGCTCGAPDDWRSDDLEIIATPTGNRAGEDPSLTTGRAGMNRPRSVGEGQRAITRYEQRHYAAQLRRAPQRKAMKKEAGEAFAHYVRTDPTGARPIPPALLESWIERGWLERVIVPDYKPLAPIPCTVLDPFVGAGTTLLAARLLGRQGIGTDLNEEYLELARARLELDRLEAWETGRKAEGEDLTDLPLLSL